MRLPLYIISRFHRLLRALPRDFMSFLLSGHLSKLPAAFLIRTLKFSEKLYKYFDVLVTSKQRADRWPSRCIPALRKGVHTDAKGKKMSNFPFEKRLRLLSREISRLTAVSSFSL